MSDAPSPLDVELAAYSPLELAELSDTVGILVTAASDGTAGYRAARAAIEAALNHAVAKRLEAERHASRTATIIPFRAR